MEEEVEAVAHDEGKKGKGDVVVVVVVAAIQKGGGVCNGGFALGGAARPRFDLHRS